MFANGSIVIENLQKKTDQGTYHCEASNDKRVVKGSVDVTVIGKLFLTSHFNNNILFEHLF